MEDVYAAMATRIVAEQAKVIGPISYAQANKVPGLSVNRQTGAATIVGDGAHIIDELVGQYKVLFGNIAVEVSREAVGNLRLNVSPDRLPNLLK
jgi:hypothetical protein